MFDVCTDLIQQYFITIRLKVTVNGQINPTIFVSLLNAYLLVNSLIRVAQFALQTSQALLSMQKKSKVSCNINQYVQDGFTITWVCQ